MGRHGESLEAIKQVWEQGYEYGRNQMKTGHGKRKIAAERVDHLARRIVTLERRLADAEKRLDAAEPKLASAHVHEAVISEVICEEGGKGEGR
jgi:chromosome segregation ATPase